MLTIKILFEFKYIKKCSEDFISIRLKIKKIYPILIIRLHHCESDFQSFETKRYMHELHALLCRLFFLISHLRMDFDAKMDNRNV